MKTENGLEISFWAWMRDLKVLVGVLVGFVAALTVVFLYMGEVLGAPTVAKEAQEDARAASEEATEASKLASENENRLDRLDRTLRITFCTSPFELSEYARIQLDCRSLDGGR